MPHLQKFVKDFGIVGVSNLALIFRGLVLLPILTKFLGPENYGIWTQLSVTLILVTSFAILRLPDALVRFLPGERDQRIIKEGVWSTVAVTGFIGLILLFVFWIFAKPFGDFLAVPHRFIIILGVIILFESINLVFLTVFRALQETGRYGAFTLGFLAGEIATVSAAVLLGYGLSGAVLALLGVRLLLFFVLGTILIFKIGFCIPNFSFLPQYLAFSLPLLLSSASFWIVQSSDRYLLGFFEGALDVGYYAPAFTLGNLMYLLVITFALSLPPLLSSLYREQKLEDIKLYLSYSLKYFLMLGIPMVMGLSVLSSQLLIIFTTQEIADQASFVTPIVALSFLLYGIYTILVQILFLSKKTKIIGIIWGAAALGTIGLNIFFISFLGIGILGAALTLLLVHLFVTTITWYASSKELSFSIDFAPIGKTIIAALLMAGVIWNIHPQGAFQTIGAVFGGAALYGIMVFLMKGFSSQEIQMFKRILSLSRFPRSF